ncbi:MAG TPA: p-hydroxycinnamoyl CoA hydratase/lyase [Phenylobacterium sp.]|uniref:p-hydroxycinnamoyl CoA hydratase/lyase n=1 Tax=Phenylobacterium sp. TaxID=1871053 RepID=UPI002B4A96D2|nr:p-hydroxycinnamoyl CoA hydratase/lyase [Phenylobacterium sp.]HKR90216.1 p-hydroxycinnamoyl CoA hydratase/lyase [Phenylobacterium sp.]
MSDHDSQVATCTVERKVAWVSLNRPDKRNSMSPVLNRRMMQILDELEFSEDVGVVVLTGAGTAFSAGMDLQEYIRIPQSEGLAAVRRAQRESYGWWRRLRWYQKPTIAMVNGWCFGGAYGPLFGCDLAFAAEEAQFGLSEINWGILPGGGAAKVAVELLSFRRAMYHAMMGEAIDGKTAAEWGLVNEAVPAAELRARVTAVAEELLKKNATALKATKDAIRRVGVMTYDEAEDYLLRAQEAAFYYDAEAKTEGIKQFIDDKTYKPGLGAYEKRGGSKGK